MKRFDTLSGLPHRSYIYQRWPNSLATMPTQCDAALRSVSLMDCCRWAGLSSPAHLRRSGISYRAMRVLARRQERHGRCNAYHNRAHIAQVILATGLLAEAASLPQAHRDMLILAALIHDYFHLGHLRMRDHFWQEEQSWQQAKPVLLRYGCDVGKLGFLRSLILATSPASYGDKSHADNEIVSLLRDADLFASLFLPKDKVRTLTAAVKFEDRLTGDLDDMLSQFIAHCKAVGLASVAGQQLHAALPSRSTYFEG